MKRICWLLLIVLTLAACSGETPDTAHVPPFSPAETESVRDLADYAAAFAAAEQAVARFTGYADQAYTDGTRMIDGQRYDRCAYGDSLEDLRAPLESALDAALIDALLEKTVADGRLLYVEQEDGTLWRFGGYVAQYGLDSCTRTVTAAVPNADGTIGLRVEIGFAELGISLTQVYSCVSNDEGIRFVGEFPLPIELALAAAAK